MSLLRPRLRAWLGLLGLFLLVNQLTRLGLMAWAWPDRHLGGGAVAEILLRGLGNDLGAVAVAAAVLALLAVPFGNGRMGRGAYVTFATLLFPLLTAGMLFTAVAEFLFWNEFSSRFNFIAVDYLVYTREVVGNIRQSYPLEALLGGIALATLVLCLLMGRRFFRLARGDAGGFAGRIGAFLALAGFAAGVVWGTARITEPLDDGHARELAGNGYRDFLFALRSNNLDYFKFYARRPAEEVTATLRREFADAGSTAEFTGNGPLERKVKAAGAQRPWHLVMVSIESLGADYVGALGDTRGLTPNLDRLAREGMLFTNLYATGLRTVRGLEALTLSVPPTPGHAVPMRPDHAGFQTLGGVLKEAGYDPIYVYGGYSTFDNMQAFFGDNGYTVIDRSAIPSDKISHETIWGVADEDLFHLAVSEIDQRVAGGKRVFAHVMTTSNHRPFTYAEGRIDIPSGSGRDGAVKYTDYSIGRLVEEARAKPWFKDTLFVFVADHTSHGRGRTDLPPEHYHIPMVIYAPGLIEPRRVEQLASQIDVAPTLLALLNVSYTSRFFGQNILTEGERHQRAFLANYLTVGYLQDGKVVELGPKSAIRVRDMQSLQELPADAPGVAAVRDECIAYYQAASAILSRRGLNGESRP